MNVLSKKIKTNVLSLAILGLLTSGSVEASFLSNMEAFFGIAGDKLSTSATLFADKLSEPAIQVYTTKDVLQLKELQLGDLFNPEVIGKACKEVTSVSTGNFLAAAGVPAVAALLLSQRRRGGRLAAMALASVLAGTSFAFGHNKTGAGYVAAILLALAKYYRDRRKGPRGDGLDDEDLGTEMKEFVEQHDGPVYPETIVDDRAGDPSLPPKGMDPFQALNEGYGSQELGLRPASQQSGAQPQWQPAFAGVSGRSRARSASSPAPVPDQAGRARTASLPSSTQAASVLRPAPASQPVLEPEPETQSQPVPVYPSEHATFSQPQAEQAQEQYPPQASFGSEPVVVCEPIPKGLTQRHRSPDLAAHTASTDEVVSNSECDSGQGRDACSPVRNTAPAAVESAGASTTSFLQGVGAALRSFSGALLFPSDSELDLSNSGEEGSTSSRSSVESDESSDSDGNGGVKLQRLKTKSKEQDAREQDAIGAVSSVE